MYCFENNLFYFSSQKKIMKKKNQIWRPLQLSEEEVSPRISPNISRLENWLPVKSKENWPLLQTSKSLTSD